MSTIASKPPASKKKKRCLTAPANHVSLNASTLNQRQIIKAFPHSIKPNVQAVSNRVSSSTIAPLLPIVHAVSNGSPLAHITPPIKIVHAVSNRAPLVHITPHIPVADAVLDAHLPPIVDFVSERGSDTIAIQNLLVSLQAQQAQIETLTQRVTQVGNNQRVGNRDPRFIINGKDGTSKHMIDEIFGRNFSKWTLAVVKLRFTDQELIENTLEPTDRSKRGHLNVEAVALLREALMVKYAFDSQKLDRPWSAVRQAVNNKGRNLALKQRLARIGNRVNTIVRTISNMSIGSNEA